MSLGTRRFLCIFFILLFLLSAPIILFYSSGYRFDFKKHLFVKTGGLVIDSKPREAVVLLNGEIQKLSKTEKIFLFLKKKT